MLDQDTSIKLSRTSDALGQTASSDARLVPTLLSIAKSTRAFLALLLAEIELHPGQDQLLHRLQPGEAISVSMLADQLAVRPSTVSKMLDRLIEKQLVVRAANNRDARRTMVALTPRGEELKLQVRTIWSRLEHDLTASLQPSDVDRLLGALEQVDDLLTVKLRRLR